MDEDEGSLHTLRLKRRPVHKDKESEKAKKLRLGRNPKMSNGVFAALCSTLSHTVLPDKVTAISQQPKPHLIDPNNSSDHESPKGQDQNALRTATDSNSSLDEENHTEKPPISSKKCSDQLLNPSENRQLNGEDCSLIPPNSSPEMTVNGS